MRGISLSNQKEFIMKEIMADTLMTIFGVGTLFAYCDLMAIWFSVSLPDDCVNIVVFVVLVTLNAAMAYWARNEFETVYDYWLEEEA
jgi:hypothetical protein